MNKEMCIEKMPITDEYLEKMNAYWRAANYLAASPVISFGQSTFKRAFKARTYQEENSRSLGNCSGTELCILSYEQGYKEV